jgi:tetratricopeptide (TPR) repeat protein
MMEEGGVDAPRETMNTDRNDLRRLATALAERGRLEDAIAIYDQLVQADPNDASSTLRLAGLQWRVGNRDEAFRLLQRLAALFMAQKRFSKVDAVLAVARGNPPHKPEVLEWCAHTALLIGSFGRAEKDYRDLAARYDELGATGDAERIRRLLEHLDPPDSGVM